MRTTMIGTAATTAPGAVVRATYREPDGYTEESVECPLKPVRGIIHAVTLTGYVLREIHPDGTLTDYDVDWRDIRLP